MDANEAIAVIRDYVAKAHRFEVTDSGQAPGELLVGVVVTGSFQGDGSKDFFEALRTLAYLPPVSR